MGCTSSKATAPARQPKQDAEQPKVDETAQAVETNQEDKLIHQGVDGARGVAESFVEEVLEAGGAIDAQTAKDVKETMGKVADTVKDTVVKIEEKVDEVKTCTCCGGA